MKIAQIAELVQQLNEQSNDTYFFEFSGHVNSVHVSKVSGKWVSGSVPKSIYTDKYGCESAYDDESATEILNLLVCELHAVTHATAA